MSLHATFDRVVARLGSPFAKLYADGFGADLEARVRGVAEFEGPVDPVEITWSEPRKRLGIRVDQGTYPSPAADYLPRESHLGHVERWIPRPDAPVCLVLPATAEEGFARRRPFARYLAAHGIGALIYEGPYYGPRRPAGQRAALLRTVADQFAMNLATVHEAAALLRTFHDMGHDVGATGYSQGGMMAAFAAAASPFSTAVVPRGAALSAEPIFTAGALTGTMRWDVLTQEAGSLEAAKTRFANALAEVRIDRFPALPDPERAIIVASRHDGFVPPEEARALHAHWPGSDLRWVPAGHFTGLVLHHATHRRAVLDAFARPPTNPIPD
ncbi:MAG: alpha/beta hydrolase family protein [Deltaproteobacteria bacterium]|nr:alpha/beta hydrolase family protein [Deltaproteobacteria bacterium]